MNFRTRRDHYKQLFRENRGLIVAEDDYCGKIFWNKNVLFSFRTLNNVVRLASVRIEACDQTMELFHFTGRILILWTIQHIQNKFYIISTVAVI